MRYSSLKFKAAGLVLFVLVVVGVLVAALVDLQVTQGEQMKLQAENSIVQSEHLEASRGDILDRYGRTLVTNEVSYNITISRAALLRQDDPNGAILRLIDVCDSYGVAHTDTMPLVLDEDGTTFRRTETVGTTAVANFDTFLAHCSIDGTQAPRDIFEALRARYLVDRDLPLERQRLAVGVRYELELRTVIGMADYVFAYDVTTELIAAVNDADIRSVSVRTASKRVYETPYAAQLLGYIGQMNPEEYEIFREQGYSMNAYVGKAGAEAAFEQYLHGEGGALVTYTNEDGDITGVVESVQPQPGQNVALTIDISLQGVAERALESKILSLRETGEGQYAGGGAAVVIEVGTGDVLACASYPTYDVSRFFLDYTDLVEMDPSPLLNRALNGIYEPGSTFKMVTATAALENGVISSGTQIQDLGKYTYWEDYQPVCWLYGSTGATHGYENVTEALRDSCNYFFFEVGRLTGIDLITQTANAYGLGVDPGLESAFYASSGVAAGVEEREANGLMWVGGDTIQAAIGQSDNQFTPLQLANYVATIANGGVRMTPHLLHRVYSNDYTDLELDYTPRVIEDLGLSEDTLVSITTGMRLVASEGTARAMLENCSVPVAAKTGTAQVGREANNAIFVCYAPYDDPQIAVAVVVEKGVSGAAVADIAVEIVEAYFSGGSAAQTVPHENELIP